MRTLLIDGDGICWRASVAKDPASCAVNYVQRLKRELRAGRAIVAFGCPRGESFRRELYAEYKADRKPTPPAVAVAQLAIEEAFVVRSLPGCEADDVMGMLATHSKMEGERILVHNDKDMLTIPGLHHNFAKDKPGFTSTVDPISADRRHMIQTLTGDSTDGYPGCPGVGPVTAEKALWGGPETWWMKVVLAYKAAGLTVTDAVLQARLARILRAGEYDHKTEKPIYWEPNQTLFDQAARSDQVPELSPH